ncbi:DHH family phosphoesterase [Natranaerobius trueperi]|nr:bifunctional oligoribonuclease/PAP phosphatase NrnA [Natranaerobius trueperi]
MKDKDNFIQKFQSFISEYQSFVITCHENADGDALGSSNALALFLEALGKEVLMIYPESISSKLDFLPKPKRVHEYTNGYLENVSAEGVLVVDSSSYDRVSRVLDDVEYYQLLSIDHHPTNTEFADINIVDETMSSTCELVYSILKELDNPITKDIAKNLYTGIFTDTGSFNYENVSQFTFEVVKELVEYDVKPHLIAREINENMSLNLFYFTREVLNNLKLDADNRIAWIKCERELLGKYNLNDNEIDGLINYAKKLQPVEFAILFRETEDGNTKVGLRSKTKDVSKIAFEFGGGGHNRAAGCLIEKDIENAKEQVLQRLKDELKHKRSD